MERADRMRKDMWSETSGTTEQDEDKGFSAKRIFLGRYRYCYAYSVKTRLSPIRSPYCNHNYNGL
jgi:hypothetical protein